VDERGVKNLAAFMKAIGTQGFADMVDSMLNQIGRSALARKILGELEGSELEKKLQALIDSFESVK
jgi:hypothetical protein